MSKTCSMCERTATARGLCKNHYYQLRDRGELEKHPVTLGTKALKDRLLEKVDKATNGCWEWTGQLNYYGYGVIWHNRAGRRAHRVSFEIHKGPLTKDDVVCHSCDNPKCVNPDHLFKGTKLDNNRDAKSKGRNARGQRAGSARLSDSAIELLKMGEHLSQRELAQIFGISQSQVSRIRSGKRRAG